MTEFALLGELLLYIKFDPFFFSQPVLIPKFQRYTVQHCFASTS